MSSKKRMNWDEYFIKIALLVSERSTCERRHVGCILVKNKRILSTGYNGAPSGMKDCLELGCLRDKLKIPSGKDKHICRSAHAEQNALVQAASYGVSIRGATLYCTHDICPVCARLIINAGIKRVVTVGTRKEAEFKKLFKEAGVEIMKMPEPETIIKPLY
jgi:dCMP deaminase